MARLRTAGWCLVATALGMSSASAEDQPRDPRRDHAGSTPTGWMLPDAGWSVTSVTLVGGRFVGSPHRRLQVELEGVLPNPWISAATAAVSVSLFTGQRSRVVVRPDIGFGIDHAPGDRGVRPQVRWFAVERRAWASGASLIGAACADENCRFAATLGVRGGWTDVDRTAYLETSVFSSAMLLAGAATIYVEGELEVCHRPAACYDRAGRYVFPPDQN